MKDQAIIMLMKADAYTHLGIGSGNEYGLPASTYSSLDMLRGK